MLEAQNKASEDDVMTQKDSKHKNKMAGAEGPGKRTLPS